MNNLAEALEPQQDLPAPTVGSRQVGLRKRPVRVLVVAPSMAAVGGQSVQADLLLRRLREEPALEMAFQPIDPEFPALLRPLRTIRFARTLPNLALYCAQLRQSIARCDLVHVFSASYFSFLLSPTPAIALARRLGKPVLLNYHSGEAEDHLARWPSAVRTLRGVSSLVVPSRYLVEVFARHGLPARPVFNAVDLGAFRFRERPQPRPAFLVNRNFEAHYNVACVLKAFARIRSKRPDATLTVAGTGPEGERLRGLAAELGLEGVRFVGRVAPAKMPALYDEHDVWINGSDVDNMPLSILEAFASGVAVVSTRAGGIPFVVEDGRTGRLVPRNDHAALADAALAAIADPAQFAAFARRGAAECLRYTWDAVKPGWMEAYAEIAPPGTLLHRAVV